MGKAIVSSKIKALRLHYNLSQSQLAEIAGVTKAAICRFEKGDISAMKSTTIKRICDKYPDLNPSWFLRDDAPMFLQSEEAQSLAAKIADRLEWYSEEQLEKLLFFMTHFL